MTDKHIIIDSVDVSGCEYCLKMTKCRCTIQRDVYKCLCEENPNCHYKQLKRKEQECQQAMDNYVQLDLQRVKEYNELVDLYKIKEQECEGLQMSDNEAREIVTELKAECEELKEKVKELNQGWIDCDKERNLQEANSEFRQRVINRYKRTLTEIKEIAEENIRISESEGLNGVYRRGLAEQILQKISEV